MTRLTFGLLVCLGSTGVMLVCLGSTGLMLVCLGGTGLMLGCAAGVYTQTELGGSSLCSLWRRENRVNLFKQGLKRNNYI